MSTEGRGLTRRAALGTAAGTVAAAAAGPGVAAAQEGSGVDFDGWFEDVSNFDGVVDRRGQSEVTVEVGAQGNGGAFAFGPAAIRVDPGTTVIWEWTGEGGGHNVVAEEGTDYAYESDLVSEAGFTFEHTFEQEGISKYYCTPHRSLGMKGAVVVGNVGGPPAEGGAAGLTGTEVALRVFAGGLAALALPVLGALAYVWINRDAYSSVEAQPAVEAEGTSTTSTVRDIGHDEYDPVGTAALIAVYFVILAVLWVFMYFVEFLGNGPTIIG
jgi:halocyanin-like protein